MRAIFLLLPAIAACARPQPPDAHAPEPHVAAEAPAMPAGWRRHPFVSGLSLAAPAEARVVRPAGIDSNGLTVTGPGYALFLDDYGAFSGRANRRVGGRRANLDVRERGGCRQATWEIELPTRVDYIRICGPDERDCAAPAGRVIVGSRCAGTAACSLVDRIVGTVAFAPAPYPEPMPIDESWRGDDRPVCEIG